MRCTAAPLVLVIVSTVASAQPPDAEATVKAKLGVVIAAIHANDPAKAMADWPEKAPGRAHFRRILNYALTNEKYTVKTNGLTISRVKAGDKELSARVRFEAVWYAKDGGKEADRDTISWTARFIKVGGVWQWDSCALAEVDTAAEIARCKTVEEAVKVVKDNTDLNAEVFVFALFDEFEAAATTGRLPAAKVLQGAMTEAARIKKYDSADACVAFARGWVLAADGRPADAVKAYEDVIERCQKLNDATLELSTRGYLVETLIVLGRPDDALKHADAAVKKSQEVKNLLRLALALHNRGLALRAMGKFADAAKSYREALKLTRELKIPPQEGLTLLGLGEVERSAGNTAAAAEALEAALKLGDKLGDKTIQATAWANLAMIALDAARFEDALEGFFKAAKVFHAVRNPAMLLACLNGVGMVHLARGRFDAAVEQFQDNLALMKKLNYRREFGVTLNNIGEAKRRQGRYGDALVTLTAALAATREVKDRPNEAKVHLNLGVLYSETGQLFPALDHWRLAAETAFAVGDRVTEAQAFGNIGTFHLAMGRTALARTAFNDMLTASRDAGHFGSEVTAAYNRALLDAKEQNGARAAAGLRALVVRAVKVGDGESERKLRSWLGSILLRIGEVGAAREEFARALTAAELVGDVRGVYRARNGLGDAARADRKWADAIAHYRKAVVAAEQLRHGTREPGLQTTQFHLYTDAYIGLANCLVESNDAAGAFEASERAKGRTLGDLFGTGRGVVVRGLTAAQRTEEQKLEQLVTERTRILEATATRQPRPGPAEVAPAVEAVAAAQAKLEDFRRGVYLANPELETARAAFAPADLKQLGATLFRDRPGLAVVSYLVGPDRTLIFVLTAGAKPGDPARLAVVPVAVTADALGAAVGEFAKGCADVGPVPDSKDLIAWLLAPAGAAVADAKELVLVPDGALHRLPFHALRFADKRHLIERCPVSYAPSATALVKMTEVADRRRRERTPATGVMILGITDFGDRGPGPLPGAEPEAKTLGALFEERAPRPAVALVLGKDATKAKVGAAWGTRRYLHFATHGEFNEGAPLFSSLLLTPDGKDEGRLYARDLLDADLRAELAVLSACQTGTGTVVGGEGLLGMSWGWFVAGVPSLVVSHWLVDDASTPVLMREFYARLLGGATKAEALRQAQLELLKDKGTRHPYYWAPFALLGDGRN